MKTIKNISELREHVAPLIDNNIKAQPYVGMHVTYCIGSDKYAGEINAISHGKRFIEVKYKRMRMDIFTLRNDGTYRLKNYNCGYLLLGIAVDYLDPNF